MWRYDAVGKLVIMTTGSLTVLFEDPFWIGLFEMIDQNGLRACKVTFGAEPTEKEVMEFVDKNWNHLQFTQPIETPTTSESKKNPKRQNRNRTRQNESNAQRLNVMQKNNVCSNCVRPKRKKSIEDINRL